MTIPYGTSGRNSFLPPAARGALFEKTAPLDPYAPWAKFSEEPAAIYKALAVFFQGKAMTEAVIGNKYTVRITGAFVESADTIYIEKSFLKQMKTRIRIEFTLTGD
jgi:hypothetical protein